MNYSLTKHAQRVLAERQIQVEWLERTLNDPALIEPDPGDLPLERRYMAIPEHGGRVLGVVVNISGRGCQCIL